MATTTTDPALEAMARRAIGPEQLAADLRRKIEARRAAIAGRIDPTGFR